MTKEEYKDAIEVSVIFHEGQRMFAVPKQPAQREQCPTCGEFEPRTGTCGTSSDDLRALCNRAAPQPAQRLEKLPEPIRTPPEKGSTYWTIGRGKWTWGGTTHDYSCLANGIWPSEHDVWAVHAAIRKALGIEFNIGAVFHNRHEAAHGIKENT